LKAKELVWRGVAQGTLNKKFPEKYAASGQSGRQTIQEISGITASLRTREQEADKGV